VTRPVRYEFPMNSRLARYRESALLAIIEREIGVRPIAITKHFKNNTIYIFFERELSENEVRKLREILSNPPKLFVAQVVPETEDEIKKRIAEKLGVEPQRVLTVGDMIVELVLDRPVDTSRLTEEDLKVRRRIVIRSADE